MLDGFARHPSNDRQQQQTHDGSDDMVNDEESSFHQPVVDNEFHRTLPDIVMVPDSAKFDVCCHRTTTKRITNNSNHNHDNYHDDDNHNKSSNEFDNNNSSMIPTVSGELAAAVEYNHETMILEQTAVDIIDHDSGYKGMRMHQGSTTINEEINDGNHNDAVHLIEAILDEDGDSDANTISKNHKIVRDHTDTPDNNNNILHIKISSSSTSKNNKKVRDLRETPDKNNIKISSSSTRKHHEGDDAVNPQQQPCLMTLQQDSVHHTVYNPSHSPSRRKEADQELVNVNQESYHHVDHTTGGERLVQWSIRTK